MGRARRNRRNNRMNNRTNNRNSNRNENRIQQIEPTGNRNENRIEQIEGRTKPIDDCFALYILFKKLHMLFIYQAYSILYNERFIQDNNLRNIT